jgi:hypothetical protein
MATLKTICENALKQLTGFRVPSAFAASQEEKPGGVLVAPSTFSGGRNERSYRW